MLVMLGIVSSISFRQTSKPRTVQTPDGQSPGLSIFQIAACVIRGRPTRDDTLSLPLA